MLYYVITAIRNALEIGCREPGIKVIFITPASHNRSGHHCMVVVLIPWWFVGFRWLLEFRPRRGDELKGK